MEVGGRGALTTFRRPLTESSADVDIEVGMDRERSREEPGHQPHFAMRGTASSPRASSPHGRAGTSPKSNMPRPAAASGRPQNMGRQRSAQTAGEALVAAALSGAGRRLPGLGAASRRAPATRQTVNEVRRQLDENLQKDGECYAVCMAGGLDLASLAEASAPTTEVARASAAAAAAGRELSQLELPSEIRGGSQSSLAGPRQLDNGLGGGLVRHFGTGENIVLHLQFFGQKDVFAFGFGCIVCWSLEPNELDQIRNAMKPFLVRPQERSGFEEETMNFLFKRKDEVEADDGADDGDEPAQEAKCISQDKIILASHSPLKEKLAHSYALAQSVRLGCFEMVVEKSIRETRSIPETLAETGEVNMEARALAKQMGALLMLRCDVNLHTDILDTPDIFWDEERFEKIYVACRTYLDIDKRVDILNQRLVVLKDLYDLLQNSLNVSHETRLEWIVIILILVEVVLEIIQLYFTPSG